MSKIPSEEDFKRAKNKMRAIDRNIREANADCFLFFTRICPAAHALYLVAEESMKFRAYVFYKRNQDIQINRDNGVAQALESHVYAALEQQGRGSREMTLVFEFDSDENVAANYEGDYFLRLH